MNSILNALFIITLIIVLYNLIKYLPRVNCWIKGKEKQEHLVNEVKNKLALCIPARNESKVIVDLFKSIERQTYDRSLFDVFVIVKEENDPTIELTKQMGGICYIHKEQNCKGDALDLCFKNILKDYKDTYKGFIVVDADCILSDNFMEEMNNSLKSGCEVCQAKKYVKNYLSENKKNITMTACCNGLIWPLMDDCGNLHKSNIGVTNMVVGTGVMLTYDLVKKNNGWPYNQTVTEDVELMNDCALNGYKNYYNSYCSLYVEEAPGIIMTNKRRSRWIKGVVDSYRLYKERLKKLEKDEDVKNRYYATCIVNAFWYVGSLTVFGLINLVLFTILTFSNDKNSFKALLFFIGAFSIIYLSFFIMTIFLIRADNKNIKLPFMKKVLLLFIHPFFYMEYIYLTAKALLTPLEKKWDVIERIDFENTGNENGEVHI